MILAATGMATETPTALIIFDPLHLSSCYEARRITWITSERYIFHHLRMPIDSCIARCVMCLRILVL